MLKSKKGREKSGLFIVEGRRLIEEITEAFPIEYCLISETYDGKFMPSAPCYTAAEKAFNTVSDTINSQGLIAVCKCRPAQALKLDSYENALLVLAENISDPGNMGTIIRTADAAGANAVLLSSGCTDIYSSKVVRASMGSIFHIQVFADCDFKELKPMLHEAEITVYATHLRADENIYSADFSKPSAIIIGGEANGITEGTAAIADRLIKIPMPGQAESINAAVACGITLYEAVRQRLN